MFYWIRIKGLHNLQGAEDFSNFLRVVELKKIKYTVDTFYKSFKGLGGFQNFKKLIFFCLFNDTICLQYSLLYGAGIDDSM